MEAILSFLGDILGNGESLMQILWFFSFIVFFMFGPKLMITQTIWKLEKDVAELEVLAEKTRKKVEKHVDKKTGRFPQEVREFMDFFAVSPISTDPFGVMKKLDHVIKQSDDRFVYFTNQIAGKLSVNEKKNVKNALAGAMSTHQIAKVVRHLLELTKKHKILQLAMILQMQFPLIKEAAVSAKLATDAFLLETPIGDGIGPLVAASLMKKPKVDHKNDFAYSTAKIGGRTIIVGKASGPGATVGKPGKWLTSFGKKHKISRIITVDAAMRMEGEKAGSVAEGVGVAMGGPGVERYAIEAFAVQKNIPLDAVAIKVNQKEALQSMPIAVMKSVPLALNKLDTLIKRTKGKILIIGVGNTCGVGNDQKAARIAVERIKKNAPKPKPKKKGLWDKIKSI
jgi:hypothetical protein